MTIDNTIYYKNLAMDEVKVSIDKDNREFKAVITTNAMDRDEEVLLRDGMNKKDFDNNPIILFNHNPDIPIGKSLNLRKAGNGWTATAKLASEGVSEDADKIWRLIKDGILKGVSVGFKILERRAPTKEDFKEFGKEVRSVVSKWKLFEFSIVSVGCNQEALITSCKNLNLDPKNILGDDYKEKVIEEEVIEKEIETIEKEENIEIKEEKKEEIKKIFK